MKTKQRAISSEDKLERRDVILNAALDLLAGADYHDISIAQIAKKAGLAKGTIFLYFQTKEDLFLQLQMREYRPWFDEINRRLSALSEKKQAAGINVFVEQTVSSLQKHPMMAHMAPILHVVLERNIKYATASEFKYFLLHEIRRTGALIEQCLPFLKKNEGQVFLLDLQVLLIGVIQLSRPAPVVKQVIEKERMDIFKIDFEKKLKEMLLALLSGRKALQE